MQTEILKRVISMLEAYHGDLEYWMGCGLENWVSCTSGTPTPHYKALSNLNEAEWQEAEAEADDDIKNGRVIRFSTVEEAIEYLHKPADLIIPEEQQQLRLNTPARQYTQKAKQGRS